jgi:hypothetical protein
MSSKQSARRSTILIPSGVADSFQKNGPATSKRVPPIDMMKLSTPRKSFHLPSKKAIHQSFITESILDQMDNDHEEQINALREEVEEKNLSIQSLDRQLKEKED